MNGIDYAEKRMVERVVVSKKWIGLDIVLKKPDARVERDGQKQNMVSFTSRPSRQARLKALEL